MIEIYYIFFIINNIFYNKKFKYKILQFNIFHLQTLAIIYILFIIIYYFLYNNIYTYIYKYNFDKN